MSEFLLSTSFSHNLKSIFEDQLCTVIKMDVIYSLSFLKVQKLYQATFLLVWGFQNWFR